MTPMGVPAFCLCGEGVRHTFGFLCLGEVGAGIGGSDLSMGPMGSMGLEHGSLHLAGKFMVSVGEYTSPIGSYGYGIP